MEVCPFLGVMILSKGYSQSFEVIHISEEMPRPGKNIPRVMIMTMLIGLFTAFSLFVTLMIFQIDMDAVRSAALPSLELIYQV